MKFTPSTWLLSHPNFQTLGYNNSCGPPPLFGLCNCLVLDAYTDAIHNNAMVCA